ncbi:MAG: OmpA family protein [Polyangiaceae bacterium]
MASRAHRPRSVATSTVPRSASLSVVVPLLAALAGTSLSERTALAQQKTFHLDRLEMPGAPDDGLVLFRPIAQPKPIFFAQLGLGLSIAPLKVRNVTSDRATIAGSQRSVITDQFTQYTTVGVQFLERFTAAATLPVTWHQDGKNPNYAAAGALGGSATTTVNTGGPAVADTRIDLRAVIVRSEDRKSALGGQISIFAPTGTGSSGNFGGDGQASAMAMVSAEHAMRFFTLTGNIGFHFRPKNSINRPTVDNGLGIGNELRWAVGGFVPLKEGRYRLGATIFGQTGMESDKSVIGNTVFTGRNTPIEWNVEGRMKLGKVSVFDEFWVGAGAGSFINPGYGAPDFRGVLLAGVYLPLIDTNPVAPDPRKEQRKKWKDEARTDTDHDGIPDDIDACPEEAEDHLGSDPNDGCPMPPDRDGDGIPDQYDRCPDQPEDKDGIEDGDGCPEDDFDKDGVPDVTDACPKEPGKPAPDPKKNGCPQFITMIGGEIKILQQVHFKTGSAEILPDSFPMLAEIADLLKANARIKRVSVEGHTDNKGNADMNKRLSQARSESVMNHLVKKGGIDAERLEAHGYGLEKPIADNATEKGRAENRRVEFKILEEERDGR